MTEPLLVVQDLTTCFDTEEGTALAVDRVSLTLARGEILGLVGESGSGKSVTGASILRLISPPGRIVRGSVRFRGEDLMTATPSRLRELRGDRISVVFQEPMLSLNPVVKIGRQVGEVLIAHDPTLSRGQVRQRSELVLQKVGIPSPRERLDAYPHELSGGMRQRVVIAIALANKPDLIIADEPTTALDVTIQSQILSEVQKLTRESRAAMIWITHDLSVVAALADRVAIMYGGRIVEIGPVDEILDRPLHPYTAGLVDSVPGKAPPGTRLRQIRGSSPPIMDMPTGCRFRDRCDRADQSCQMVPSLATLAPSRQAACFHPLSGG